MSILTIPSTDKTPSHWRFKMYDGTKAVKAMALTGKVKGSFTDEQTKFMEYVRSDVAAFADSHPVPQGTGVKSAGGIHIDAVPTTGNACVDKEVMSSPGLTAIGLACGASLPTSVACTTFKSQIAPLITACNGAGNKNKGGNGLNLNLGGNKSCGLFDLFCGGGILDSGSCEFDATCGSYDDFAMDPYGDPYLGEGDPFGGDPFGGDPFGGDPFGGGFDDFGDGF
jgi:hypothetical protein